MKRVGALCVCAVCLVLGCSVNPPPSVPPLHTDEGKANGRVCLATYNACTPVCWAMRSNACVHQCNDSLASCYATAEELIALPSSPTPSPAPRCPPALASAHRHGAHS